MKQSKIIFLAAGLLALAGCGGNGAQSSSSKNSDDGGSGDSSPSSQINDVKPTYTIRFDSQGGSPVASVLVTWGEKAIAPQAPSREGFLFAGWFKDTYAVTPFVFEENPIYADWTLYAGWKQQEQSDTSSHGEKEYLYFTDAAWWAKDGAHTALYTWEEASIPTPFPGPKMEKVAANLWRYDLSSVLASLIFVRVSPAGADWGAKTVDLKLSDRGSHNMYDISGAAASWGDPGVTGFWADYRA